MQDKCYSEFSGRCAVITGAASGIGKATAFILAKAGALLVLVDKNRVNLEITALAIQDMGIPKPLTLSADISNYNEVSELNKKVNGLSQSCDYLVTCAGILRRRAFLDIPVEEWEEVVAVNLTGSYLCCREIIPSMVKSGRGVIVLVASMAGRSTSVWGGAHYTASKHGVIGLARHLAKEFGPDNLRVNAFCPGGTITPMVEGCTTAQSRVTVAEGRPLRRWATANEQAKVITFLLSEQSSFITGAALDSNGGALMV